MKRYLVSIVFLVTLCCLIAGGIWGYSKAFPNVTPPTSREVVEFTINPDASGSVDVPASKLPEFTYNLASSAIKGVKDMSPEEIIKTATAEIIHTVYADEKMKAAVTLNEEKHSLVFKPEDVDSFRPGKYKLSFTLRTLEGEVKIEQDFTWGVIAINTNKSIYKPGDVAFIGMGVLNDSGETHCKTGIDTAKVWLTVTEPNGTKTDFSTETGNIRDSGECGPTTVTNKADFVSLYMINGPGIYSMKVTAEIKGERREIVDYFKVEESSAFDVERKSFPTRIYPKGAYPVSFTVTPREDYTGTIEDFMPSDFKLEKISDNGKESRYGEFKKLTWKVSLKKGQPKSFTYMIHFPLVSPEFYLMGPLTIGTFKEARQWQIASDAMNTTSGVVAYEDNSTQNTWSRTWSGTAYGTEVAMAGGANTPTDSRWFREVSSPKTGEKLMAVIDNDTANSNRETLYVYRWTGTAWATADIRIPLLDATGEASRIMDIAYEEISGDTVLVFADKLIGAGGDARRSQILYRTRVGTTWSSTAIVDTADLVTGTSTSNKTWIKLRPQKNSDTILMGYVNSSNYVGAMVWDGSTNTWGDELVDNAGGGSTQTATNAQEPFDVVWETQSGAGMLIWGSTGNDIVYRRYSGGAWGAQTTALSGFTNDVAYLVAAADGISSSNNIAVGTVELVAQTCRFVIWNGSTWTQASTVTCRANIVQREIGVVWEYNNGKAMWAYVTSALPTQISYRTWQSATFGSDTAVATGAGANLLAIQIYSDTLSLGTIVLTTVVNGANAFLYSREWDGGTWGSFSRIDTHASGIQGNTESAEAYGFGFDRNLETLAAYRWFANANNVTAGSALTIQDTPYTLTSQNEIFRLRLLIYFPDSLAISGRLYKLQYVDPGTGTCASPTGGTPSTWTDVTTVGTDPISFYTANTAVDGANLSSNGSDPTYSPYTKVNQTYEEGNTFTNSASAMSADQVGLWDFALIDNTTYDRNASSYCFRVSRSSNLVLQIGRYPQLSTAAIADVLLQGGSLIQGGSLLQ